MYFVKVYWMIVKRETLWDQRNAKEFNRVVKYRKVASSLFQAKKCTQNVVVDIAAKGE